MSGPKLKLWKGYKQLRTRVVVEKARMEYFPTDSDVTGTQTTVYAI